jgi:hypothetical protein
MRRRALLTCTGVTLASIFAGCLEANRRTGDVSGQGSTPTGTLTQTETPTSTSTRNSPTDSSEETATETATEEATSEETAEATEEPETDSRRGNWSEGWSVQPPSWTTTIPEELSCENGEATRVGQGFDESELVWGNAEAWEIRIDETAVSHGNTLQIQLKNVTDDTRSRRAHSMYNLQVETESGWQEVRTYESREQWGPPPAVIRTQDPGEVYE